MATQVGEAVIKLTFDGKDVKASLNKVEKEAESSGKATGRVFGDALTVAAGNLIAKGLSTVFSKISSGLDTAISRVDTLHNSQKVFTAMGYSAEATSDSMETLKTYLDGLPTSMTTAVKAVQSLSASFGGIEKGTEVFIDLNNAGLAFGASTQEIETAIMQLGELSLDGPLDAATWRSLQNNGFTPVFTAMANEAGVTVGELKQSFGSGERTVGDFLNALHRLNVQGSGEMDSLANLARANTEGIGTALENVQNRIGKAIGEVIEHIGVERISGIINKISSSFMQMADVVIGVIDFIAEHWAIISPILGVIGTVAGTVIAINLALKAYHKIQTAVNAVVKLFGGIINGVSSGISKVTNVFNKSPIGGAADKVGNIFKKLGDTIKGAVKGIGDILKQLATSITEPLKVALKGVGEALAGFFQAMASPAILMGALTFTAAAAAIAAAIWLIGSAVGAIQPVLEGLFNNIVMPIANFIADTLLNLIEALTNSMIMLTQGALIPLGEFLTNSFVAIITAVADVITNLTQNAVVPLLNTLSGAFTSIVKAVADLITGVLQVALEGIANIIKAVGEGFYMMGQAIKSALDGVSGVLHAFADLIHSIADAVVAVVAMVTGHSVNYGAGYAHLFAEGGKVEGPGTTTSDSIPAMLSDGEYVINARSAQMIGYDTLDKLNEGEFRDWTGGLLNSFGDDYSANSVRSDKINVYMTNQINNKLDAQEIGQIMLQSIRRAV